MVLLFLKEIEILVQFLCKNLDKMILSSSVVI